MHFTAETGWINDPYGIVRRDGAYHMYYQYVPDSTEWDAALWWGHAMSPDLVQWREVAPALEPLADEVGCWSGSVVFDEQGPVLLYTRPTEGDWGHGMVVAARATSGMDTWERTGAGVLIDGPPDPMFIEFRDPNVRRQDGRWVMVLGAGIREHGGAALQYSSDDLEHWEYDGVLARSPAPGSVPMQVGTIWECPQFIEVDDHWVLIVSDADWKDLSRVIYAIGDYDGRTFTPRTWGDFGHTRLVYATTAFRDADGRPCTMSWLREGEPGDRPPAGSPWAGAQSLVHVLRIVDGRLVAQLHPDVDAHLPALEAAVPAHSSVAEVAVAGTTPWRVAVEVEAAQGGEVTVDVSGEGGSWQLRMDLTTGTIRLTSGDAVHLEAPLRTEGADGQLDLVVDADIVEVTWSAGEGVYAARVPVVDSPHVAIRR